MRRRSVLAGSDSRRAQPLPALRAPPLPLPDSGRPTLWHASTEAPARANPSVVAHIPHPGQSPRRPASSSKASQPTQLRRDSSFAATVSLAHEILLHSNSPLHTVLLHGRQSNTVPMETGHQDALQVI
ncbi:uncharacterized protein [Miscanthus floridulus]|uniref:uncharacterized protein isoform X2 n=1 Tax=Miscanthus floridulus TaxID=154761 RepID=UPI0034598D82